MTGSRPATSECWTPEGQTWHRRGNDGRCRRGWMNGETGVPRGKARRRKNGNTRDCGGTGTRLASENLTRETQGLTPPSSATEAGDARAGIQRKRPPPASVRWSALLGGAGTRLRNASRAGDVPPPECGEQGQKAHTEEAETTEQGSADEPRSHQAAEKTRCGRGLKVVIGPRAVPHVAGIQARTHVERRAVNQQRTRVAEKCGRRRQRRGLLSGVHRWERSAA